MSAVLAPAPPPLAVTIVMPKTEPYACVRCASRKVKCDKLIPNCTKCERGNVVCEYKAPPTPRRRKRKLVDSVLHSKLQHYEKLLKQNGLPVDFNPPRHPSPESDGLSDLGAASALQDREVNGRVFEEEAQLRRDQNPLWQSINDYRGTEETSSDADEDIAIPQSQPAGLEDGSSLLLCGSSTDVELKHFLPPVKTCWKLWRVYQDNFNPLSKVIHVPSVEPIIAQALSSPENLSQPAKVLVLAIFTAAVHTLDDEDCLSILGEPYLEAASRYRLVTQQALVKANLLSTSDTTILQAFFIFLASCRNKYSAESLWALSGVALRIGQRLGYRGENCSAKTLFEGEMRRRLWWNLAIFDSQISEIAQQGSFRIDHYQSIETPLNVNDSDLHPSMTKLPQDRDGPTEMMLCRIRYEVGSFFRSGGYPSLFGDHTHEDAAAVEEVIAKKDRAIEELQGILERRYLRYWDPLDSAQMLGSVMARCVVAKLKLISHHPRQYPDKGAHLPESEKAMLFNVSLTILEYDTVVQTTPCLKGFKWHTGQQLQWLAMVHMLSDLRTRGTGVDSDRAWAELEKIFVNHPEICEKRRIRPLYRSVCSLAVTAWDRREAEHGRKFGTSIGHVPLFITYLREQRRSSKPSPNSDQNNSTSALKRNISGALEPSVSRDSVGIDFSMNDSGFDGSYDANFDPMLLTPVDWTHWDEMVREFEWQETQTILG